jgi:hypothetical protein
MLHSNDIAMQVIEVGEPARAARTQGLQMRTFLRLGVFGFVVAASVPGHAQLHEVEFAKQLVQAQYFEGLPYLEARELAPAGVEALITVLANPAEAEYHANIVMALGISGDPQAYSALSQFHDDAPEGEIDGATYRARRALPLAMGHLARSDPRAYQFLADAVDASAVAFVPEWSYRYLSGERLEGILRRAAVTGLAISGQPQATVKLDMLNARAHSKTAAADELRTHIREAQRLHDRIVQEGPAQVFGPDSLP